MIKSSELIDEINKVLHKYYPIKKSFDDIKELSHFHITNIVKHDSHFPFKINLKSNKIAKVYTTKYLSWNNYIKLYLSFFNIGSNPIITDNISYWINRESKIDILHINSVIMEDGTNIDIKYKFVPNKHHIQPPIKKISKDNHFYFSSFDINSNKDEIKTELLRLFINRDKYKSIHFHLDNNGGGDNVPAHLILKCLTGKKEKWMKNIKKMKTTKELCEWDCWEEDKKGVNNYDCVQMLNLGEIPIYNNKYKGKIHLHMNNRNGSAAWYFITYLIYAFGSDIKRYTEKHYGQTIKFGTISTDSQLVLHGISNTTSGDGNAINILFKNINIFCPTEQFLSCSIKEKDLNRFWVE